MIAYLLLGTGVAASILLGWWIVGRFVDDYQYRKLSKLKSDWHDRQRREQPPW